MQNWNKEMPWPKKSDYILRCIEEGFAPNNNGNPMVTLKYEVVSPQSVTTIVGGKDEEVGITGVTIMGYYTLSSTGTAKNTAEGATKFCQDNFKKVLMGFDRSNEVVNWDNPALGFKGKTVYAHLQDKESPQYASPTKEQLSKGQKIGAPLINPKTKKPLTTHYPEIVELFGIAELPVVGAL